MFIDDLWIPSSEFVMFDSLFLLRDEKGGVAVLVALSLVVIMGALGVAIDAARGYSAQNAIKAATDSAALAAVSVSALDLSKKDRRKLAKQYFRSNCGDHCGDIESIKVRFRDKGATVSVRATTKLPTTISRVLAVASKEDSFELISHAYADEKDDEPEALVSNESFLDGGNMRISAESVASAKRGFAEIHLALDTSESMNIPNTDADIQRFIDVLDQQLGQRTWAGKGCMFACHGTSNGASTTPDGRSYFELARDSNIELRQDVVRRSAMELVEILRQNDAAGQFSVGVATFALRTSVRQAVTHDLDQVMTTLSGITGSSDYTDFHRTTRALKGIIGEGGDGSSAERPAKVLVLVTDGAQNISEQEHGTIDPAECDAIKQAGDVTILVLHLIYGDVQHFHPNAGVHYKVTPYTQERFDNLAACASPGLYFEANQGNSISEAFQDIADALVVPSPRLIQ